MTELTAAQGLFKQKPSKAESKADLTTNAARAIIDAEARRRMEKTERLRQARLTMESQQVEEAPVKKARATRAKATRTKVAAVAGAA